LLRLLRLTRMARIMRFFPELLTIVKGIVNAIRAVFFIQVFLVLVMYIFAIVFTSQLGVPHGRNPDAEDKSAIQMFDSIGSSMMTLFTNGVLGDNLAQTLIAIKDAKACHTYAEESTCPSQCTWADEQCGSNDMTGESKEGLILMWLFLFFFAISAITLLNMLIGVLCQVVDDTARDELESNQVHELEDCLKNAFRTIDVSENGFISAEEWSKISDSEEMRASLERLGVESSNMDDRLLQMQHTLFGISPEQEVKKDTVVGSNVLPAPTSVQDSKGLSFNEFIGKVVDLRWDTPTSALDLEMLKRTIQVEHRQVNAQLDRVEDKFAKLVQDIYQGRINVGGGAPPAPGAFGPPDESSSSSLPQQQARGIQHGGQEENSNYPGGGGGGGGSFGIVPSQPSSIVASSAPFGGSLGTESAGYVGSGGGCPDAPLNLWEVPTELLFHMLTVRVPN